MRPTITNEKQSGNRMKTVIKVFFPSEGITICEHFAADTLKSVVTKIGLQRVADACLRNIDSVLNINNVPLVTKRIDNYYENRQHPVGNGWYVFTGTNTMVKKRQLDMLKELFHLNMRVTIM